MGLYEHVKMLCYTYSAYLARLISNSFKADPSICSCFA